MYHLLLLVKDQFIEKKTPNVIKSEKQGNQSSFILQFG